MSRSFFLTRVVWAKDRLIPMKTTGKVRVVNCLEETVDVFIVGLFFFPRVVCYSFIRTDTPSLLSSLFGSHSTKEWIKRHC